MRCKVMILALVSVFTATTLQGQSAINIITIDGIINPPSGEFIHRSLDQAAADGAGCLVLQLDTPGGLVESMRDIVKDIMASPVPVVVYVAPSGARAASAGTFITMAGHIAAMAPGTNIGAASVVSMGMAADSNQATLMRKANNDAVAFIKSIAEERKRNIEWAEKAVTEAASITASEALDLNVIDFLAPDLDSLLAKIDGRTVETRAGPVELQIRGAPRKYIEMPFRFKVLDKISDPNIAYILFIIGIYGLFFELYNPGTIFPGVVGALSLILAFYAMNTLPINTAGILLILLAIVLFVLEIKVPSYGILTVGGVSAFLVGSLMLYDTQVPFVEISLEVVVAVTVFTTLFFVVALGFGIRAQRRRPAMGKESLVGAQGEVLDDFRDGRGQVLYAGEIWEAESGEPLKKGKKVRVLKSDGLKLMVTGAETPSEKT